MENQVNTFPQFLIWLILATIVIAALFIILRKKKKVKSGFDADEGRTMPLDSKEQFFNYAPHSLSIGNAQHIGKRSDQQDSFGISDVNDEVTLKEKGVLAVLADGMGGLSNGAVLSGTVVQAMQQSFKDNPIEADGSAVLLRLLSDAMRAVNDTGIIDGGTTTVATLVQNNNLYFLSVGDSRLYLLRNGGLLQLNREHIYGRELDDMAINGYISKEEAESNYQRGALTSYIGKPGDLSIDRNINPVPLYPGDKVILMSDGVYGYISENEMTPLLLQEPMKAAQDIQNAVLEKQHSSQDNLTIIILEV